MGARHERARVPPPLLMVRGATQSMATELLSALQACNRLQPVAARSSRFPVGCRARRMAAVVMTPDAAGIEAALAAGLAAHREGALTCYDHPPTPDHPAWCCECGAHELLVSHRAHVAAALLPVVTQAQAEALREAADRWTQGAWADVMLPKPTPPAVPVIAYANRFGDWLRARADESGGAK